MDKNWKPHLDDEKSRSKLENIPPQKILKD